MKRYFWTIHEEKILREQYPVSGSTECVKLLPRRSLAAIYNHARSLRLNHPKHTGVPQKHWAVTEEIDRLIIECYQNKPEKKAVQKLAKRVGRPRWWVSKRATKLGLQKSRFKEESWTDAEKELLRKYSHKSSDRLWKIFRRHDFKRTETAIIVMRKRLQYDTIDIDHYTASNLAGEFGVDVKVITRWIENGWLKAKRRGTNRVETQGGDMYWIKRRDVRKFIVESVGIIDIRKVDKVWFVDLLANP